MDCGHGGLIIRKISYILLIKAFVLIVLRIYGKNQINAIYVDKFIILLLG